MKGHVCLGLQRLKRMHGRRISVRMFSVLYSLDLMRLSILRAFYNYISVYYCTFTISIYAVTKGYRRIGKHISR